MKKTIIYTYILFQLSCTISCGNRSSEEQSELDSLRTELRYKSSELYELNLLIDAVNIGMDTIGCMENIILRTPEEHPITNKEQLRNNIEAFKLSMQKQRERIQMLEEKLRESGTSNEKIKQTIFSLRKQLEEKDIAIAELAKELEQKNFDIKKLKSHIEVLNSNVAQLQQDNKKQEAALAETNEALAAQNDMQNIAYYIIGTKQELKNKGVLSSGFLKKTKISANNIDNNKFTKIDIRKVTNINIPAKKAEVLSQMPSSSYTITKTGDNACELVITDASLFWSQTKYLIIKY